MSVSKEVLARVAKQIFGTTPRHVRGKIDVDTPYVGAYLASYYQEPIENSVRKVSCVHLLCMSPFLPCLSSEIDRQIRDYISLFCMLNLKKMPTMTMIVSLVSKLNDFFCT